MGQRYVCLTTMGNHWDSVLGVACHQLCITFCSDNSGFIGSSSENWIYTERREQQCTGARGGGARGGGGASLVAELLYAPVLLGDLRLELVNASLG